ncbi:MAG TPA: pyridoxal-dependent decarboxylase [Gammaproteobacteria bacterium]
MPRPKTPLLTVDLVIELLDEPGKIVLVERKHEPFGWALPGGFVDVGETVEEAAVREAKEETGLEVSLRGMLGVWSDPGRDPRGHTASVVFLAEARGGPRGGDDARDARSFDAADPPNLAFDHARILEAYVAGKTGRKALLEDAAARAAAYLDGLEMRRASPGSEALQALELFDQPLNDAPVDAREVLAELDANGSAATMASAGGRYFGFVIGASLPAALAANVLAGAWDQNAGLAVTSPIAAKLEDVAGRWLVDLLRLPETTAWGFVSGDTMANFCALAAARHALLAREGWDVAAKGLYGAPQVTVIIGGEAHVSIQKALVMLGLGRDRVVTVPADGQGRMRVDAIPETAGPTIVCAQAGNVNTGSFDAVGEICRRVRKGGAWVHVDAAFGIWARASESLSPLVEGLELADSWATDGHKWLNVPYDSGIVFTREANALPAALSGKAAYLVDSGRREPWHYTAELSRRARGVEVWAALRALGRRGLAGLIERNCAQARRFAEALDAAGFEILNDVVLNQVLVSFGDDETTRAVIAGVQEDGTCWAGGTTWQGRTAMRISVSSWATTDEDVEASIEAMLRIAESVR